MNERIEQLIAQSRKVVGHTDGGYTEIKALDPEKFAELIIEECITYCGENLSKTVGGALKIHFGIKE